MMPNSLGSLGEFQIDPDQDFSTTGMRHAGTAALPVSPATPGEAPPLVGPGHGPELQAELERKLAARSAALQVTIPELLADCEKALSNFERHYERRDCRELETQIRNEFLAQLLGHHVAAEITRAMNILREHYDPRWSHVSYLRDGAWRFRSVGDARKCHGRLIAAKGPADFLVVAKELLELCKLSLAEPRLLRPEEG